MSETNGRRDVYITRVDVESLHRLRFARVELTPEGQLVRVHGKNASGKSSLLRAIREGLGGAGEVLPEAINDESEDGTGSLRLELSNGYTIQRRFTEANPKGYLTVVGPDGGKHGQGRINEWLGRNHSFDVLSIFDLKPERLTEILLGLAADPDLKAKLDAVRGRYTELYEERTPHIAEKRRCKAVPKPEGERPNPVDVSGEMERLRELQAADRERGDLVRHANRLYDEVAEAKRREKEAAEHIQDLERQLERAREDLKLRRRETKLATTAAETAREEVEATPDPTDDIEAVQARISEADAVNARLEPWREYERAQESLEKATKTVEALTDRMEETKGEEQRLIAESGIPVEGLTFDPETAEPLLNGRPLAVASGGERIRMALDIAIAADPELKVVLVDEANDLDLEMLEALRVEAEERGYQIWVCRIGLEGGGQIIVENGVATNVAEPAEAV